MSTTKAFRTVKWSVGCYLGLSVLTLAVAVLLRNTSAVNSAVWIRGSFAAASGLVMTRFVAGMARGSSRAFLRLRIVSAIIAVAIAVIVSLPGTFPLWMKIEQAVCGLILLRVAFTTTD
jgi:hypothetical protein